MKKKGIIALAIILTILVIDQIIKIYIKTHFYLHESYEVTSWFYLAFTENNGMAFGVELFDKFLLTSFRIIAVAFFTYILAKFIRKDMVSMGFTIVMSMIIAGAMGNIFDCMFYGEIFNNPYTPQAAHFVPWGEGYGTVFEGMVVDMLYFPLFSFVWPEWMPWVGGSTSSFFDPVFNIADAAISVGILALLFFYHRYIMVLSDSDIDKLNAPGDGDKTK